MFSKSLKTIVKLHPGKIYGLLIQNLLGIETISADDFVRHLAVKVGIAGAGNDQISDPPAENIA